jgi:hypothetical protein
MILLNKKEKKMISPAIQRSIEIQEAAKQCGIAKPKMTRIVNLINKEFPHHPAEMIAETINEIPQDITVRNWKANEIAELVTDIMMSAIT